MKTTLPLLLALLATLQTLSPAAKPRCGDVCTFHFCRANADRTVGARVGPRILLRDKDVASQPFVCRKIRDDSQGTALNISVRVIDVGEAQVHPAALRAMVPRPFVRISKYKPAGRVMLNKKFRKSYFTLREIKRFPPIPGEKGIARQKSRGNQEMFLNDLCVLIPVTKYDIVDDDDRDTVIDTIETKAREDCVSIRSVVPTILVELTWDSSDDFDLSVKEPTGEVVSFRNTLSETKGRLIRDTGVGVCGLDPEGREQVRWLLGSGTPADGTYTVTVKHFTNCMAGSSTKWSLAVIVNGERTAFKEGSSSKGDDKKVTKLRFKYEA